jgi:hypothetical protein
LVDYEDLATSSDGDRADQSEVGSYRREAVDVVTRAVEGGPLSCGDARNGSGVCVDP